MDSPHLEPASRSRLCCTTEAAGLMLGVAQRDALRSHWSSSFSSSSSVGPPASAGAHTHTHVLQHTRVTREPAPAPHPVPTPTPVLALADHVHGGGQVPHLDAAVGVAGEQVAPGPRAHPAGALALPHGEGGDGGAVHGLDLTDPGRDGAQLSATAGWHRTGSNSKIPITLRAEHPTGMKRVKASNRNQRYTVSLV